MKPLTFAKLFNKYFDRYEYMKKKYPKAAKKRRICKKWKNRFGKGLIEIVREEMMNGPRIGSIFPQFKSDERWKSTIIHVPFK